MAQIETFEDLPIVDTGGRSLISALDAKKISFPNNGADFGNSGDQLRSLGNGGVEWAAPGMPTYEQTEQAISDWLNAHPEATTTVADGAITDAKLNDALKRGLVYGFETVADMKAADTLTAGMICHTNGFYASGDGGAAWYEISATGTANEMDVIVCGELFANLIIGNEINLAAIGLVDTVSNATSYFERGIDLANDEIPVTVNEGIYNILTPIDITTATVIKHNGYVVYNPVGVCFNVSGSTRTQTAIRNGNCLQAMLGGHSWAIVGESNARNGKIGIRLNTSSADATTDTKRNFYIENGNFSYLEIGFQDCAVNSYLYAIKNCQFEPNDVCYQYGIDGITKSNSGENITFDKCVFSGSKEVIKLKAEAIIGIFNDCSFDFNDTLFVDDNKGYHVIKIIGGHIEGTGQIGTDPAVFKGEFKFSNIALIGSNILILYTHKFAIGTRILKSGKTRAMDDYGAPQFRFIGCSFEVDGSYDKDYRTFIGEYIWSKMYGCEFRPTYCYMPSLYTEHAPYFDNDNAGAVTFQSGVANTSDYTINSSDGTAEIVTDSTIGHKIMTFSGSATIRTKEIVGVSNHVIAINRLSETPSGASSVAVEVTYEDGSTESLSPYQSHPTGINTGLFSMAYTSWGFVKLGPNVKSIKGRCNITNANNFKFGGIMIIVAD